MHIYDFLLKKNFVSSFCLKVLCFFSNADIPSSVKFGKGIKFPHGLNGIVLHPLTKVEDNVTIYHQVTSGRGDLTDFTSSSFKGIVLKSGSVICCGAKIINNRGLLVVGENTIVGANAVLTSSTGDNEVWVGVPAKCIKKFD